MTYLVSMTRLPFFHDIGGELRGVAPAGVLRVDCVAIAVTTSAQQLTALMDVISPLPFKPRRVSELSACSTRGKATSLLRPSAREVLGYSDPSRGESR